MNATRSSTLVSLTTAAVWSITGCSAPGVNAPPGLNAPSLVQRSWIEPAAKSKALLYVSDEYAGTVNVYAYPSLKPVGVLSGFKTPEGICVDARTGAIWVTDTLRYSAYEYAHGGTTPIRRIHQPYGYVQDCSVNPVTSDVAIANITDGGDDPGYVAVYKDGKGKPATYYVKRAFEVNHLGYDEHGDLFVDAIKNGVGFVLDKLPAGGRKLDELSWRGPRVKYPGGVQYDGKHVAVADSRDAVIYQTDNGVVTGTTKLQGACWVGQIFVDDSKLIAPSACKSQGVVLIYHYPDGGSAVKTIAGFQFPAGAVVSR